jgi:hypothetical protein
MAVRSSRFSDLSGELIPEGRGVRIRIEFLDGQTIARAADLTEEEAAELLAFATPVAERPGRQTRVNPRQRNKRQ